MKKVSIVNKFGPMSKAITGQNAKEIADFLLLNDIEVTFICLRSEYKSRERAPTTKESLLYKVKELRGLYAGKVSLLRLISSFCDGFRLWLASTKPKVDATIVMTDPPLLFFWFQLFRRFSRRKLFYWTMDLYPEAFVAGNYINPGNLFYRFFHSIIYNKKPDLIIALGDKQLQFLEKQYNGTIPHVILPCGIVERKVPGVEGLSKNGKISFGYSGNIGEAHDAEFLVSFIKQLNPEKHRMILSLYGSKAEYVTQSIQHFKIVEFRDFLSQSDIASLDINVATLLPEWNHICVPSKAVTAICCGSTLLLNAEREVDAWQMFKDAGWLIEAGVNDHAGIQKSIDSISKEEINRKRAKAAELADQVVKNRNEALNQLASAIKSDV